MRDSNTVLNFYIWFNSNHFVGYIKILSLLIL
jgi:hypothetical protein